PATASGWCPRSTWSRAATARPPTGRAGGPRSPSPGRRAGADLSDRGHGRGPRRDLGGACARARPALELPRSGSSAGLVARPPHGPRIRPGTSIWAGPRHAHTQPGGSLDLEGAPDSLRGRLTAHVFDLAGEIGLAPPET